MPTTTRGSAKGTSGVPEPDRTGSVGSTDDDT